MGVVTIPRPGGAMPGYLAVPAEDGPWPGVLVVHDALGMTTDARNQADWLAGAGYLALVPDLFSWGGRIRCVFASMRAITRRSGRAFDDLEAARRVLVERDDCTGRVGVVGFCLGGGFAVLLAAAGRFDASSVNYGDVPEDAMTLLSASCPVVASFGGRDRSLRRAPARLERALSAHAIDHDVTVYPAAGHGFLNDHARGETPRWAVVAGALARTGYHEPSARDARRRIVAFFDAHLVP